MSPSNHYTIQSTEQFQQILSQDLTKISLINFWAPWAEPCQQMNTVVAELAKKHPEVIFLEVEAESQSDITESFDIEAVPSFVILRGHTLLDKISGADAIALTGALAKHTTTISPKSFTDHQPQKAETPEELEKRMRQLMTQSKVVLFMKGNPETPRCGFSRKIVALLQQQHVQFTTFDILSDEDVRQGLKKLNNWPTFPQLIINGELAGGLDIVEEMAENGELQELIEE